MSDIRSIGIDLVRARRDRGMSQRALGERLGVKQQQVARWEADSYRNAALERIADVAEALGVALQVVGPPATEPEAWGGGLATAEDRAEYAPTPSGEDGSVSTALRRIGVRADVLAAFARSHGIARLELFGSVLTEGFGPDSDVDVLVTYQPGRTPSLITAADHELELSAILRRRVDLVSRAAVERGDNPLRRRAILTAARPLYVSG